MIAALPTYYIDDAGGREVAFAVGYEAARSAARYMLEAGEEPGPLDVVTGADRRLVRYSIDELGAVVGVTRQGVERAHR